MLAPDVTHAQPHYPVHFARSHGLIEYNTNISKVKCRKEVGHLQSADQSPYKEPGWIS